MARTGARRRPAGTEQTKPLIGLVYASTTDEPVMKACEEVLERFGVAYETVLFSAHRQPERTATYAKTARERGLRVLIAGAGMAAALPGVIASMTTLPVIGVPLVGSSFGGSDALLSMVQMPAGVPVATVAAGKAGAKNAALLALQILAISDTGLARKIEDLKRQMEAGEKL
ncbi:MAG: 5-(carboxyamino)imidazole ribonucleotide mutase [Candidatus Eisenbacteria sp.]|nr:5-(carboxyamino)imidazole ribonucleotide mutase [Candidatus Eisenbacteria bacterium]